MLTFELQYSTRKHSWAHVSGILRRIGDAGSSSYFCELAAGDQTPALSGRFKVEKGSFIGLPTLVARGISAALARQSGGALNLRTSLLEAQLTLLAGDETLLHLTCWRAYGNWDDEHTWADWRGFWPPHGRAAVTPWRLAQFLLWRAASDISATMPKVYVDERTPYCLSRDLPEALRQKFEQGHYLTPQPLIPGRPDAFHAQDVVHFLGQDAARNAGWASKPG